MNLENLPWTRKTPTQEGVYWCKHVENGIVNDIRTCIIINRPGQGWRIVQNRTNEYGNPLAWFTPAYFEWVGPLQIPN